MLQNNTTVRELAETVEVSEVTVHHWRQGRRYPSANNAFALAELYKVSVDDLFRNQLIK